MVSLSFWFRVPSVGTGGPALFSFNNVVVGETPSFMRLYSSGIVGNMHGHVPGPGPLGAATNYPFNWGMKSITANAWHHFFFAIDISTATVFIVTILDGVRDTHSWNMSYENDYPGWPINLSTGGRTALGWLSADAYPTPGIREFADVQAWYGTYIDASSPSNFAKFISITGGKGYPVNPSIAAAAFGRQTILFKGKASDNSFFVNRGNGGAFTKIGTASDFTPGPSY